MCFWGFEINCALRHGIGFWLVSRTCLCRMWLQAMTLCVVIFNRVGSGGNPTPSVFGAQNFYTVNRKTLHTIPREACWLVFTKTSTRGEPQT